MFEPTGLLRDAASVLFNLPDYRVIEALDRPQGRLVVIESLDAEGGCPSCGVLSSRVHQRTLQRIRDVPIAGAAEVRWSKRRFACSEHLCARRTFAEHTVQVPPRARSTVRLGEAMLAAVTGAGRTVSEVASSFGVAWWSVQVLVNAAAIVLAAGELAAVRRLGVDEHRYRSVRFFRDPITRAWHRYEPWMTTFVDLDSGQVLGVVDGRDSSGVSSWLTSCTPAWRDGVQVVAIDPSAAFRKALRENLPLAAVSVDHFHLVQLANDMVTVVRQRVSQQTKARRGRGLDPSWANRRLLLRGADTLTKGGWARLKATFRADCQRKSNLNPPCGS